MPPLQPGDPGDGHGEDHHDEDDVAYVPPLPPEDRLWRHPSEVASGRAVVPAGPPLRRADRRTAALMVASGVVGATLAVGAVAVVGGFEERVVERQVAVRTSMVDDGPGEALAVAEQTGPSVAGLVVRRGEGTSRASAVVLRSDGYLVTDGPAVASAHEVEVVLHDGRRMAARTVGIDGVTGIAVLHLEAELEGAVLAHDQPAPAVGSRAFAVGGWPDGRVDRTVSVGAVSAVGRRLQSGGATRHGMILVDEPFAPGTAGGALVDQAGVVVGLVADGGSTGDGVRFGVATPIDLVRHVADQIVAHGRATHVWLGLHGTDLDPEEALELGLAGGSLVEDVEDGGPAGRAGILPGDVVVALDGEPTPTMSTLIVALRRHLPGDVVTLDVHRDGEARTVRVTLDARS